MSDPPTTPATTSSITAAGASAVSDNAKDNRRDDEAEFSSLRIHDRLLSALPPHSSIEDDQLLSLGTSLGVAGVGATAEDDGPEEEADEPIFETSFDLTPERLRYVFDSFDTDEDGKIDYESLKRGLKEWQQQAGMQISKLEGRTFATLVSFLDSDNSGDVTFEEFSEGFRLLMLRALLPMTATGVDEGSPLNVLDYDATRLEQTKVGEGGKEADEFFFNRREDWVKTRWVDVVTADMSDKAVALTMRRLAVKYLLHPLALEDALEPDVHRPKVEVFSSHYFLVIPVFSLVDAPSATTTKTSDRGDDQLPTRWYHWQNLCTCCKAKLGRVAEKRSPSRRPRLSRVRVEMISIFVNVPRNDTIITFNQSGCRRSPSSVVFGARENLWLRVQRELEKSYSKLRQYDAQYLTYALLDQSVDLLVPIIKTMRRKIADEKEYLRRTNFKGLRRIHELRADLEKVCRTIKPYVRVLTHVIEDDAICPGVTVYLRDVLDNLECEDDDLRHLIEQCHALDLDADKYQDRQMNRTLYMLTVISAIFLPAQFLTGVWGMNFSDMPELETDWGYDMFWVITATMTCVLLVLFCIYGRLDNIED